jgi:S1-C subfamily serine protease
VYRRVQPAPDAAPLLEESSRVAGAEFRRLTPELAEYFRGADHGLLVLRVLSDTPAARLGLRGGDVVLAADGRPLEDVEALRERFARSPRAPVELTWVRRGVEMRGRLGPD